MELGWESGAGERAAAWNQLWLHLCGDLEGCILSGDESQLIFMQCGFCDSNYGALESVLATENVNGTEKY